MKVLPNNYFREIESLLLNGSKVRVRVDGDGMFPFLRGGKDIIGLTPVTNDRLRRGTIALFRYGEHYIIHRIVMCKGDTFVMQGDGNSKGYENCKLGDILGTLDYVERNTQCVVNFYKWHYQFLSEIWIKLLPIRPYLLAILKRIIKRKK